MRDGANGARAVVQLGQLGEWNRGRSLERTTVGEVLSPISRRAVATTHTAKDSLLLMLDSGEAECVTSSHAPYLVIIQLCGRMRGPPAYL